MQVSIFFWYFTFISVGFKLPSKNKDIGLKNKTNIFNTELAAGQAEKDN